MNVPVFQIGDRVMTRYDGFGEIIEACHVVNIGRGRTDVKKTFTVRLDTPAGAWPLDDNIKEYNANCLSPEKSENEEQLTAIETGIARTPEGLACYCNDINEVLMSLHADHVTVGKMVAIWQFLTSLEKVTDEQPDQ